MKHRSAPVLLVASALLLVFLSACSSDPSADSDKPPNPPVGAGTDYCGDLDPEQRKAAEEQIRAWSEAGELPTEASGATCDFYRFAWREFLALNRVVDGRRVFEDWANADDLFGPGGPKPWPTGNAGAFQTRSMSKSWFPPVEAADDVQAASLVPLIDQQGRMVHYAVQLNQTEYDFISCCGLTNQGCYNAGPPAEAVTKYGIGQPPWGSGGQIINNTFLVPPFTTQLEASGTGIGANSTELKSSWRVLEPGETGDDFVVVDGTVRHWFDPETGQWESAPAGEPGKPVRLAMVGLHVITKTKDRPGWIWSTFEHKRNAPLCPLTGDTAAEAADSGEPWLFHDNNCSGPHCLANSFCSPCARSFDEWLVDWHQLEPTDADCQRVLGKTCAELTPAQFQQVQQDEQVRKTAREALIQKARDGATSDPITSVIQGPDGGQPTGTGQDKLVCTSSPNDFHSLATPLFSTTDPSCKTKPPIKTQVCRRRDNGQDPIPAEVRALNQLVAEALGSAAPANIAVLANYELIGTLWDDGTGNNQQGALGLSNATMETFEPGINCLVCHGANQFNPNPFPFKPWAEGINDRSFVWMRLEEAGRPGACTQQTTVCAAHGWDPANVCPAWSLAGGV
ncbi:MAG: hypothetical protein AAF657_28805 [Acidobacteriota bacterium]